MKLFFVVFIVAVFGGVAYFWNSPREGAFNKWDDGPNIEVPEATLYFYGEECPHCKDVAKFLEENKVAEKVQFEKKEVWHNKSNATLMNSYADLCGLDVKAIGVPFLYAEGKCYIGTPDVTAYFKKAAGIE